MDNGGERTSATNRAVSRNGSTYVVNEVRQDERDGTWVRCIGASTTENVYLGERFPADSTFSTRVPGTGESCILTLDEMERFLWL